VIESIGLDFQCAIIARNTTGLQKYSLSGGNGLETLVVAGGSDFESAAVDRIHQAAVWSHIRPDRRVRPTNIYHKTPRNDSTLFDCS
jgi:hypothetical protein